MAFQGGVIFHSQSGLCYRADRELWLSQGVHPHCDPLPLWASRGGQAEEEDMRPPPCVPQRRGDQNTNSCAGSAVTHTDAGPQEAVLFVCPAYTFMPLPLLLLRLDTSRTFIDKEA